MKRKFSLLLAALCLLMGLVGCSRTPDTPMDLEILAWDAGYGLKWLDDIAEVFQKQDWVKEKYPGLTVNIDSTELEETAENSIPLGAKNNSVDLFFASSIYSLMQPDSNGKQYVLDMSEAVYNQKVPGEDVLYKDKVLDSYLKSMSYVDTNGNSRYLAAPWAGGMNGIIYNADILEEIGEDEPLTTDELLAICEKVKGLEGNSEGLYDLGFSIMSSYDADYTQHLFPIWWAQYQTVQGYENFYQGIDGNRISIEIFNQKGRLYSAEVLENMFKAANGYNYEHFRTTEYKVAQTMFLQGNGLFMVNGDWFENEMRDIADDIYEQEGKSYNIKIMKTPILSKITELTPTIVQYADNQNISVDEALALVVKSVDEEMPAPEGVSDSDFKRIKDAREVISTIGPSHLTFIPDYATAKDVAVDFVRFMATDEANVIYAKATGGATLPFKIDLETLAPEIYSSLSDFQKSRLEIFKDYNKVNALTVPMYFPLRRFGNVNYFYDVYGFTATFGSVSNPKTAQEIFDDTKEYWTQVRWDNAKTLAGITG